MRDSCTKQRKKTLFMRIFMHRILNEIRSDLQKYVNPEMQHKNILVLVLLFYFCICVVT